MFSITRHSPLAEHNQQAVGLADTVLQRYTGHVVIGARSNATCTTECVICTIGSTMGRHDQTTWYTLMNGRTKMPQTATRSTIAIVPRLDKTALIPVDQ